MSNVSASSDTPGSPDLLSAEAFEAKIAKLHPDDRARVLALMNLMIKRDALVKLLSAQGVAAPAGEDARVERAEAALQATIGGAEPSAKVRAGDELSAALEAWCDAVLALLGEEQQR